MSLDQTHYDVAILSTGLPQSILSAALSAAGLSVIHLDENDYYADQWASLTLSELQRWCKRQGKRRVRDVDLGFPAHTSSDEIPAELRALDRHYAISLAPTLLPASGPSIDTLIASKVSSYATFRLLEQTAVYLPPSGDSSPGQLAQVPASKQDIFKTKDLSLIDKRKLMKLLLLILSDNWDLDEASAAEPFVEYLAKVHKLSPTLIDAVAYGVSLCSTSQTPTREAMLRAKSHLTSTGRYGNSAYLVGQYGGAGELAQGYCRASAVKGGVFILDRRIHSARKAGEKWTLRVADIDEDITADCLVSGDELWEKITDSQAGAHPEEYMHRGVLVLDRCIDFRKHMKSSAPQEGESATLAPETGLIVFPPGSIASNKDTVLILMMGEGTFSCPKGQYVYYIETKASISHPGATKTALRPVIDQILLFAKSEQETSAVQPLLQLTYLQVDAEPTQMSDPTFASVSFPPSGGAKSASMNSLTDSAVEVAKEIYYAVLASRLPPSDDNHETKVAKLVKTLTDKRGKRRKRHESEYQGRGGRGIDDGVSKEDDDTTHTTVHLDPLYADLMAFFETTQEDLDNDD